jgi:hypothetical protein
MRAMSAIATWYKVICDLTLILVHGVPVWDVLPKHHSLHDSWSLCATTLGLDMEDDRALPLVYGRCKCYQYG